MHAQVHGGAWKLVGQELAQVAGVLQDGDIIVHAMLVDLVPREKHECLLHAPGSLHALI